MHALRDRFRWLLTPPGRPGEALGVPASGEDVRAEIAPLLSELDRTTADAQAIVAAAAEGARSRQAAGRERAHACVEQANSDARRLRAQAVAAARRDGARRAAEQQSAAEAEVRRIEAVSEQRVTDLAGEVIACVRRAAG